MIKTYRQRAYCLTLSCSLKRSQVHRDKNWRYDRGSLYSILHSCDQLRNMIFCLRNVFLGPPHDVQSERVDPCRKFLLCLDQRNLFPSVQILDHHTGEDFLCYNNTKLDVWWKKGWGEGCVKQIKPANENKHGGTPTSSVSSLPELERGRWGPGVCSPLWDGVCSSSFSWKKKGTNCAAKNVCSKGGASNCLGYLCCHHLVPTGGAGQIQGMLQLFG